MVAIKCHDILIEMKKVTSDFMIGTSLHVLFLTGMPFRYRE